MSRTLLLWLALLLAGAAHAAGERIYVVEPGDSLSAIAARWTGDPQRWEELYRANRDQIKDPSLLYPGQRLVILERWPDAPARSHGASARE